ncbi:MAG: hypothetical protein QY325_04205 [Flavobacteriales bacterium]|nr:MAG: hypothetical protein QY325_04205 [Flavobacteriales bacterium]
MNLSLTTASTGNGKCYTLAYDCLGEPTESSMETTRSGSEERRLIVGTLLVHAFTRKADRFVATGMDLVAPNDGDLRAMADKCAHLVIWLDEGSHSSAEALEAIRSRLPLFVRLVGHKESINHGMRRSEWLQLNDLAALIGRVVEGEDVFTQSGQLKAA